MTVEWMIKGPSYSNCNCDWGCPCQFNKLPTHGDCRAAGAMRIDEGHFGDVKLDGLYWVNTYCWPGAVHEGNGTFQTIIDERADEYQRDALTKILHGEEAEEPTFLSIFASTMTKVHDPLFMPIEFECDLENTTAKFRVPGILESEGKPMSNPVTGEVHRAQLVLPDGMEFKKAYCGSGTTKATGEIKLDLNDSWGQFAIYHLSHKGALD